MTALGDRYPPPVIKTLQKKQSKKHAEEIMTDLERYRAAMEENKELRDDANAWKMAHDALMTANRKLIRENKDLTTANLALNNRVVKLESEIRKLQEKLNDSGN